MKNVRYAFFVRRLDTILAIVILSLSLTAAMTGIILFFYYKPTAGGAYNSLKVIKSEIPNGWLIQRLHEMAGNGPISVSLVEIVVMFLGEQFRPSWLTTWLIGILWTLTAIALGWTAILLEWTQLGYCPTKAFCLTYLSLLQGRTPFCDFSHTVLTTSITKLS